MKRSIYWNKYKVIHNIEVSIGNNHEEKYIRERPDASYQEVKRLFLLAYDNTAGDDQVSIDSLKNIFFQGLK